MLLHIKRKTKNFLSTFLSSGVAVACFLLQGACMTTFLSYRSATVPSSTIRQAAADFKDWMLWMNECDSCNSFTDTKAGADRGVKARYAQLRWIRLHLALLQLIPDILGSSKQSAGTGCSVSHAASSGTPNPPRENIEETWAWSTNLEGQCAYSITRCGVSARPWKQGPVGVFFWKVSDKLSRRLPLTPFPNPARSCFADKSARRGKPELHGQITLQFLQVAALVSSQGHDT